MSEPRRLPVVLDAGDAAEVPFVALDTVWFQLAGTLCNIACRHCFITCGPHEDRVPMMATSDVLRFLDEAERLGARDYYFTGGEPMMHPDFWALCEAALARGALTVLTNGMLIDEAQAARAGALFAGARYSFDLRVSLDGTSAAENDPVRGRGTFDAAVAGLGQLARAGLSPAITVIEHSPELATAAARTAFLAFARELGIARPRVKFLPLLRIGREERRTRGYATDDIDVLRGAIDPATLADLVCASGRLVTPDGVMTCPILLDAPDARVAATLAEARRAIRLRWAACRACVAEGLSCRT
jgi:AdoMet-dependent heme synthase